MMVKVIADSISPQGIRLPTIHARYWRSIHAELMTHRVFSRNARSSRAVPSRVLLTEPIFIPVFGMNKPGMQSDIVAPMELQEKWRREWQDLAAVCRDHVERWAAEGMHKQHANRPLEWFGWIDVLISSTEWENFFALRVSEYAQPEFNELAQAIRAALDASTPELLQPGQWHLPYVDVRDRKAISHQLGLRLDLYNDMPCEEVLDMMKRVSTARCARLSYEPFDGNADYESEVKRYEKLVVSQPVHASPAEHQATPDRLFTRYKDDSQRWQHPELHGNFHGWIQNRKTIPNEAVHER